MSRQPCLQYTGLFHLTVHNQPTKHRYSCFSVYVVDAFLKNAGSMKRFCTRELNPDDKHLQTFVYIKNLCYVLVYIMVL